MLGASKQTLAGAAVTVGVAAAALVHSMPPRAPDEFRAVPTREAQVFYVAAAEAEVSTRKKAEGRFRGSPWSRDDDFHNKEAKFIRTYAKAHRFTIAGLVDAEGRAMHEGWATPPGAIPDQKVLPCRPRLTY